MGDNVVNARFDRLAMGLLVAAVLGLPGCKHKRAGASANEGERAVPERDNQPGHRDGPPTSRRTVSLGLVDCPRFDEGVQLGVVEPFELGVENDLPVLLHEISGVIASRSQPGVLYVHNDGADQRLYALSECGRVLGTFALEGVRARDVEDIAIGPGPAGAAESGGRDWLYVGDIGDNPARKGTGGRRHIWVHRFAEPHIGEGQKSNVAVPIDGAETLMLRYPGEPHDAEAMFVDPVSGDLFIVTKENDGDSQVLRARAPLSASHVNELEVVASIRFGSAQAPGALRCTAGDIEPGGAAIVLRTYATAVLWPRAPGQSVADALAQPGIEVPSRAEVQGEAVAFAADGRSYYTISEGAHPPIWRFSCARPGQ